MLWIDWVRVLVYQTITSTAQWQYDTDGSGSLMT